MPVILLIALLWEVRGVVLEGLAPILNGLTLLNGPVLLNRPALLNGPAPLNGPALLNNFF